MVKVGSSPPKKKKHGKSRVKSKKPKSKPGPAKGSKYDMTKSSTPDTQIREDDQGRKFYKKKVEGKKKKIFVDKEKDRQRIAKKKLTKKQAKKQSHRGDWRKYQ